MENLNLDVNVVVGVLAIVGVLAYAVWQTVRAAKAEGELGAYKKLGDVVSEVLDNSTLLDIIENVGKHFSKPALSAVKGIDWLETFTPDDVDAVLEKIKSLVVTVTDGKPNAPLTEPTKDVENGKGA